ncbi:MAG: hypothetical protein KAR11_00605 [Phycisphaerae bacterium]|nr:hypothetical protein [Phycisphaerae bacterium]
MTIVCLGDSLTTCGGAGGRYSDYLQTWLPNCKIINKGILGDTLDGGRSRFHRDALRFEPNVVIIGLGANDYWQASQPIDQLAADLESMVSSAKNAGVEVIVAGCFGEHEDSETPPENEIDEKRNLYASAIAAFEFDIVKRYHCYYVPDMQIDITPNGTPPYWADINHPNKTGNELVAKRIYAELQKALSP